MQLVALKIEINWRFKIKSFFNNYFSEAGNVWILKDIHLLICRRTCFLNIFNRVANSVKTKSAKCILNIYLSVTGKRPTWIGGSDILAEGVWLWNQPNVPVIFFDWWTTIIKQPEQGVGANCLCFYELGGGSYQWADEPCYHYYPFICER